jgi:hypothetical protein
MTPPPITTTRADPGSAEFFSAVGAVKLLQSIAVESIGVESIVLESIAVAETCCRYHSLNALASDSMGP